MFWLTIMILIPISTKIKYLLFPFTWPGKEDGIEGIDRGALILKVIFYAICALLRCFHWYPIISSYVQ